MAAAVALTTSTSGNLGCWPAPRSSIGA